VLGSSFAAWAVRHCAKQLQDGAPAIQALTQPTTAGSAHGNPNDYVTYAGLTLKKVSGTEYAASKLLGTAMW
jgi:hypothetical protein